MGFQNEGLSEKNQSGRLASLEVAYQSWKMVQTATQCQKLAITMLSLMAIVVAQVPELGMWRKPIERKSWG